MPIEWVLSDQEQNDLDYIYLMMDAYPRPVVKPNLHCERNGHAIIRVSTKPTLRKEYKYNRCCIRCYIIER